MTTVSDFWVNNRCVEKTIAAGTAKAVKARLLEVGVIMSDTSTHSMVVQQARLMRHKQACARAVLLPFSMICGGRNAKIIFRSAVCAAKKWIESGRGMGAG